MPEFAYVLGLASTDSNITTEVNTREETCKPTGTTAAVQSLILRSVANLRTDLAVDTDTRLDEFATGESAELSHCVLLELSL